MVQGETVTITDAQGNRIATMSGHTDTKEFEESASTTHGE